jgi:hypothetical protein
MMKGIGKIKDKMMRNKEMSNVKGQNPKLKFRLRLRLGSKKIKF